MVPQGSALGLNRFSPFYIDVPDIADGERALQIYADDTIFRTSSPTAPKNQNKNNNSNSKQYSTRPPVPPARQAEILSCTAVSLVKIN